VVEVDGVQRLAAGGRDANETLEIPRMVFVSGNFSPSARTASIVCFAEPT
jgi:hypothetical protein